MSIVCYLVNPRGFCSGVHRAVDMAEQVLKLYKEVYIVEDIIHNKVFMKEMIDKGFKQVNQIDEIPDGSVVMLSAHGVPPETIVRCEKKGLTIVDATCPIVSRLQKLVDQASKEGKTIILIGNRSHSEIVGLLGCTNGQEAYVVSKEGEVDMLPDMTGKQVVYFTQTTLDRFSVRRIVEALKKKIPQIEIENKDNICCASIERQAAVRAVAPEVDLVIVVGSRHSSNTMRLGEVAAEAGARKVIRVDSPKDFDGIDLHKEIKKSVAITSGASVPEYVIEQVVSYLATQFDDFEVQELEGVKCSDDCDQ